MMLVPLTPFVEPSEAVSARAQPCGGSVCINEVMPNPNGYDNATWPNGEWLELYNGGTASVDVRNWYFSNKASKVLTLDSASIVGYNASNPSTYTIAPGDYMIIARNASADFYAANKNDFMTLYDSSNGWVDEATWNSSSSSGVPSGVSLEEDPANAYNDWIPTSNPTPGSINSGGGGGTGGPTYAQSDVIINEVMADPWPSYDNETWPGGEWVELYNNGTSTIDLTGYWLQDIAGNMILLDEGHLVGASSDVSSLLIHPQETRIVAVNSTSNSGVLNNGQETLRLYLANGSIGHEVMWSSNQPGFSLEASPNGAMWQYSTYPTPNATNAPKIDEITSTGDVVLNEIYPVSTMDGTSAPDGEWVEFYNTGTIDVDLNGWSIIDGMGNVTFLDPGSIVVNSSQGSTMINAGERRLVEFTADTRLWDNYNHVVVRDSSGTIADMGHYTTNYGPDISLVRGQNYHDPWTPSVTPSPGQPEPTPTPTTGDVKITEVLPDAVGSDSASYPDGEWLEIRNMGAEEVDVAGWRFSATGRTLILHQYNMPSKSDTVLQPGETTLIALNGTSQFYLKHTTPDQIFLYDGNGVAVHSAQWTHTLEGVSLINHTETHAGAGPSGTNAPSSSTTWSEIDWLNSAWSTPGEENPVWPAYSGSEDLLVTEIATACDLPTFQPAADWIELYNNGSSEINLSRWILHADYATNPLMGRQFIDANMLYDSTSDAILSPMERVAVELQHDIFGPDLDDVNTMNVLNPDGELVLTIAPPASHLSTTCATYGYNETNQEWIEFMWPTPGSPEPDASMMASIDDIKFSSIMWDGVSSISTEMEFFELTNIGTESAILNGWKLKRIASDGSSFESDITNLQLDAGSSVKLSNDVAALELFEDGNIIDMGIAMENPIFLLDSGMALQLIHPTGVIADTIVYKNGPVDSEGWSGVSLSEPVSGIDNLILYRGDGCGLLTDTNQSVDWHQRWGRLGASDFCQDSGFDDATKITPLIAPEHGLMDIINWIDGAQTSLHVHLYILQSSEITQALIDAKNRGVDVVVVLNEPEDWWNSNDNQAQKAYAYALKSAGVEVHWFGGSGDDPYLYLHSKVAVRDDTSVWIGSGNWKPSSLPYEGDRGNRDWGILVDSAQLAANVKANMAFDENSRHVQAVSSTQPTISYVIPDAQVIDQATADALTGTFSGQLLTCPDDCVEGLTELIQSADSEILLSLQYLDLDWKWGWGENPLVSALEQAATDGVSIRLIINGAYLDEDIQDVVDRINNDWNITNGWDASAVIMSEDDDVMKLHNKGAIVDGESVLISSINWGDSAMVRNREMGLIITSTVVAAPFIESWYADWNRLDNVTDTDNDGMPDIFEVNNGLNRTISMHNGELEADMDNDDDGLSNLDEYNLGGNPLNSDTDGDCIPDAVEVSWAQATALNQNVDDVSPRDAINLADADGDGVDEASALGCDLGGIEPIDTNNGTTNQTSVDDDQDGVLNSNDECPDTPAETPTDVSGCSSDQRNQKAGDAAGEAEEGFGENFMLILMLGGLLLLVGAVYGIVQSRKETEATKDWVTEQHIDDVVGTNSEWEQPVLDGRSEDEASPLANDLERFPGWTEEMLQQYLDHGWTLDQLEEYYQQQVAEHS
ncbi:MAG: lamin tail domain-containing protein [Candidatus Thermoplasmatota archaeon]|nr:lamin tail domain-containing protein [Candidatus Thermoplasmatota archaeon]